MNRVLYEAGYMDPQGLKFLIFSVFVVLFLYFVCFKGLVKIERKIRIRGRKIIVWVLLGVLNILEAVVLFMAVIYVDALVGEYIVVLKYKTGHYTEIEGIVEDYSYVDEEKKIIFTVDGVEFRCPNNPWGYYPKNESQNVIKGNGQHLRIRYIFYDVDGNVILYIEQLEQKKKTRSV